MLTPFDLALAGVQPEKQMEEEDEEERELRELQAAMA